MIHLISQTFVDFNTYITEINSLIGRSPTRRIDSSGKQLCSIPAYISSLENIINQANNPNDLSKNSSILHQASLGFLLTGYSEGDIILLLTADLKSFVIPNGVFLTGTIFEWRIALKIYNTYEELYNTVVEFYTLFDKLGLGGLWQREQKNRKLLLQ